MNQWRKTACGALLALLLCGLTAPAQSPFIQLPTNVSDLNGGPLLTGFVYRAGSAMNVPAGLTLTVQAGAILKFDTAGGLFVAGTVICNGTAGNPAVFTAFTDDTVGGDSNSNGPSTGSPADWNGLRFSVDSDASSLSGLEVRFAGNGQECIDISGSDLFMTDCLIRDSNNTAIDLSSNSFPTINNTSIMNCNRAITGVDVNALPGFTNNQAAGNTLSNQIGLKFGVNVAGNLAIDKINLLNDVLFIPNFSAFNIPSGTSLTLGPGVVVKQVGQLFINGTLHCNGTELDPVRFTSHQDDSVAGDSNGDGPSVGAPGDWDKIVFSVGSEASVLDHTILSFAGGAGAIDLGDSADIALTNCLIEKCQQACIEVNDAKPTVVGCAFNEGTVAIKRISWPGLAGFRHNTATGNSVGDYAEVRLGSPIGDSVVFPYNYPNGALVVTGSTNFTAGTSLTLHAGVVIKRQAATSFFNTNGALNILGTGLEPVVMTSLLDDDFGGDTNKDGNATTPQPGDWREVRWGINSLPSTAEHLLARFGGASNNGTVDCQSSSTALRSIRVEHGMANGFDILDLSGDLINCVAYHCGAIGVDLNGGSFNVIHATVVDCDGIGIDKGAGHTGAIANSIVRGNIGGDLVGFSAAEVFFTNADPIFAGMNGNIAADPSFVGRAMGDLNLASNSPCLDIGDIATANAVVIDHFEASRRLDSELTGTVLPDLGAYERAAFTLSVSGQAQSGMTQTYVVDGPLGFAILFGGLLDGIAFIPPYGFETVGNPNGGIFPITPVPVPVGVGFQLIVSFPPSLENFPFGVQALGLLASDPSRGNLTNRYRSRFFN